MKTASQCSTHAVPFAPRGHWRNESSCGSHPARHINNSFDGENRNGNCEEGRRQEGAGKEGRSGQEGGGKEGSGQEGRSGEEGGTGQEGRSQEVRPRQEAHSQRRLHEGDDPEPATG